MRDDILQPSFADLELMRQGIEMDPVLAQVSAYVDQHVELIQAGLSFFSSWSCLHDESRSEELHGMPTDYGWRRLRVTSRMMWRASSKENGI
jgi:hypothetical protein